MDIVQWIIILFLAVILISRIILVKGIMSISVQEAKNKFKDNKVQFIDVRTAGEYKANHRKPFKNIPLSNLASSLDKLDWEKEVVVICQSGMRSAKAAKVLKKNGFERIYNGGMSSWV